jgi:hypothetical protein
MLQVNRPMEIGELLDGAFRAYRAHFARLVLISAIFLVPVGVATTLLLGFTVSGFSELFFATTAEADLASVAPNVIALLAIMALGVLGYVAMALACVSLISYIVPMLQGEELSVGESIRRGLRRLLSFVGMAILVGLGVGGLTLALYLVLALFFFVIAAAVAALSSFSDGGPLAIGMMIVVFMFYFVAIFLVFIPVGLLAARWLVAPAVVVAERLGPKSSLSRSWALTRNNLWRCFGFLVLLVIFNFVVIGLPISILQWVLMFALTTQWYGWLSGLVAGLSYFVNILWYPILILALTLLYFDLRVRNESLDLDVRIRVLEQSVQPGVQTSLPSSPLPSPPPPPSAT